MSYKRLENASVAPYCSMKVGGRAKRILIPESIPQLAAAVRAEAESGGRYVVMGNCSNVIFPDTGFDGTVILTGCVKGMRSAGCTLTAACGETLSALSRAACNAGIAGFEFCYGIPGTVGGGIFMNAGAYGGEISGIFLRGVFLDKELREVTLEKGEMDFGYRKSVLAQNGYILLSAEFAGTPGESGAIREKTEGFMRARRQKQPLEYPSCGSAFKRPEGHYAGALIEQCGLKGVSVGGAYVSEKHAGFIVNKGGATASDVIALIKLVRDTVYERTGIMLEPEIRVIG